MPHPHLTPRATEGARFSSPPWQSRLFITAFVCAHVAALGAAYAAAALQAQRHEIPTTITGEASVHHVGRMALIPLSEYAPPMELVPISPLPQAAQR